MKLNERANEALNDMLTDDALRLRIDLSDAELLDYVRSFNALRKQFELILNGKI